MTMKYISLEIRDGDGNDFEGMEWMERAPRGSAILDLHVLLADRNVVFFGAGDGVAEIHEQAFAGHFEDA